jgi:hypothetical protein
MPLENKVEIWDEEEQDWGGLDVRKWEPFLYKDPMDELMELEEIENDDLELNFSTTVNRKRLKEN